ncbi:MAG: hypothetical protein KAI43_05555 [Candidatus Aureabacteria bacterium]|nr:hypothetical protein [Candidatus Auribacterota bacterium]
MNLLNKMKDFFQDPINPIVLKELRQAVRSKFVTGALMLFLCVLLITFWIYLGSNELMNIHKSSLNMRAGKNLFQIFFGMLSYICIFFIPIYTGVRFASERASGTKTDLLFTTTISPNTIIRGKLIAGIIITILLFSACMPFMVFTYLLRGIDIPSIFITLIILFFLVTFCIQVALFLACIPGSRTMKVLIALVGLLGCFILAPVTLAVLFEHTSRGIGSKFQTQEFWIAFINYFLLGSMIIYLLYRFSIAIISPPAANRALPIRLSITMSWLLTCVAAFYWVFTSSDQDILFVWGFISIFAFSFALLVASGENDSLSIRVLKSVPHSFLLRPVSFIFYNGPAGGIFWAVIMALSTILITKLGLELYGYDPSKITESTMIMFLFFVYVYNYILTSILIQRKIFRGKISRKTRWIIALSLMSLGAILPVFAAFFMGNITRDIMTEWQYANIFSVFDDSTHHKHIYFAGLWAIIITFFSLPWFYCQTKNFRPFKTNKINEQ